MRALLALGLLALAGCHSYDIVQSNIFSNDDGFAVRVDYGRAAKDHVNTFTSPVTGEEMTFKSRLVVEVTLPDGQSFVAWQGMNFLSTGTLYQTEDKSYLTLVHGFTCRIYAHDPTPADPGRYREIYSGVLCDSPKSSYKPNPKWRRLTKDANGRWK